MSLELPRWLRLVLFLLGLCLIGGIGFFALRMALKPVTLRIAVGSLDADTAKVMSTIGSRMIATKVGIRLTVIQKPTPTEAAEAFAAGEADLAIVRADTDDVASARAIVHLTNLVVMVMVPPNSPIKSIGDLKGKTVGVVGLDVNQRVLAALVQSYGFAQGSVQFVNIPLHDVIDPSRTKKYQAAIFVAPLTDKYNALVRGFFPATAKAQPRILEIESAEAIAISNKYFELFDMPKGALRGAPALPDDSISTLRVPTYLVAKAKLSEDTASALAKAIMEIRRELLAGTPILAQVSAPDEDKDAPIPIHPGAKVFFSGDEKTWFDRYGDWLFYGTLMMGMVGSAMAGLWKFLTGDGKNEATQLLQRISSLIERSRKASSESELAQIETECDEVLSIYLKEQTRGQIDSEQSATVNTMINHLESSLERRYRALRERQASSLAPSG